MILGNTVDAMGNIINIIEKAASCELVIKKSRFLAVITPCISAAEARQLMDFQRLKHTGANHLTYAYRLLEPQGMMCRYHDDGEPSGTAGKPIYKHLEGRDLVNVLLLVVRYFGGVKLGKGGLTRAYGSSAKLVLENCDIRPYYKQIQFSIMLEYHQIQAFEYFLGQLQGKILQQQYNQHVQVLFRVPEGHVVMLREAYPEVILKN